LGVGSLAIGHFANVAIGGENAVAIGTSASISALGARSIAIGYFATATAQDSIVFGAGASANFANECVMGSELLPINTLVIGQGEVGPGAGTAVYKVTDGGVDPGWNVQLAAGSGTPPGLLDLVGGQAANYGTHAQVDNAAPAVIAGQTGTQVMVNIPGTGLRRLYIGAANSFAAGLRTLTVQN
jgi:hypothetical protein